jgi:hypothetical protein
MVEERNTNVRLGKVFAYLEQIPHCRPSAHDLLVALSDIIARRCRVRIFKSLDNPVAISNCSRGVPNLIHGPEILAFIVFEWLKRCLDGVEAALVLHAVVKDPLGESD